MSDTTTTVAIYLSRAAALPLARRPGWHVASLDLSQLGSAQRAELADATTSPVFGAAGGRPAPPAADMILRWEDVDPAALIPWLEQRAAAKSAAVAAEEAKARETAAARERASAALSAAICRAGVAGLAALRDQTDARVSANEAGVATVGRRNPMSPPSEDRHAPSPLAVSDLAYPIVDLSEDAALVVSAYCAQRAEEIADEAAARQAKAREAEERAEAERLQALAAAVRAWGSEDQQAAHAEGLLRHAEIVELIEQHLVCAPLEAAGIEHLPRHGDVLGEREKISSVPTISSAAAKVLRAAKAAFAGSPELTCAWDTERVVLVEDGESKRAYTAELTATWRGITISRRVVLERDGGED